MGQYTDDPRNVVAQLIAAQDATRTRLPQAPTPHTISAYNSPTRGGVVEKARDALGLSNLPQEPNLLIRLIQLAGLDDPASVVDGPARAMAAVGTLGDAAAKTWRIIDRGTGQPIGKPYTSRSTAKLRADKLDEKWGATRYHVVPSTWLEGAAKAPDWESQMQELRESLAHLFKNEPKK